MNKEAFEEFRRNEAQVESAYAKVLSQQYEKSADREEEVFDSIELCSKALENLPFKMLVDSKTSSKLFEKIQLLKQSIDAIEQAKK